VKAASLEWARDIIPWLAKPFQSLAKMSAKENVRKRRLGTFANEFEPGGLILGDERK
jgi:hypothetical protein